MNFLTSIGALYVSYLLYRFVSFISLYFLNTYSLDDYLTGESPYAIVTGASDGIGKGIARELYLRGFNLILHGRNAEKTQKAADEIRALRGGTDSRDIRIFLADADKTDNDFQSIVAPFKDLNISLLVNNVGGSGEVVQTRIDEWPLSKVFGLVYLNVLYSLGLTHALMPQFRRRAGKCLVVNVGSFSAEIPPPRVSIYAACKSCLKTLTWSLSVDERYFDPTNIRFIYMKVGQVQSNVMKKSVNPIRPSSEVFGRAVVNRMACGRLEVAPYPLHAVSQWFAMALGETVGEWLVAQTMKQLFNLGNKKQD